MNVRAHFMPVLLTAMGVPLVISGCSGGSNLSMPMWQPHGQATSESVSPGVTYNADGSVTEKILGTARIDPNARVIVSNVRAHAFRSRNHRVIGNGAQSRAPQSNPNVVIYHGGPTLFNAGSINVYVNPPGGNAPPNWSFPGGFIGRYSLSKMDHIMDQYTGAIRNDRYPYLGGLSVTDGASGTWGNAQIDQILQAAINATGNAGYHVVYHVFLTSGQQLCTTSPYPSGCYGTAYCSFHGSGDFGHIPAHVIFTVEPWQQIAGCIAPSDTVQNDTASALSREMTEAFTDPDGNAWYNASGDEIGDICQANYGDIMMQPGAVHYNIQTEWLISLRECGYGSGLVTQFHAGLTGGGLGDITSGSDGNLWFVESVANRVGRITPTGTITEFSNGISMNSTPNGITSGSDGNLWFTESGPAPQYISRIDRITPAGVVTEFSNGITPDSTPQSISSGPDGNLWFTESFGNRVGRITPAGVATEFTNGILPNSYLFGIASGPDGNLWVAGEADRIYRITPLGAVTEFTNGITPNSTLYGIAGGPDGNVWFTEQGFNMGRIGRITPTGTISEFSSGLKPNSGIFGITSGPDGNVWFTDANCCIGRITPAGIITEFPVAPALLPTGITTGRDGNLWFTAQGFNVASERIGRLIP